MDLDHIHASSKDCLNDLVQKFGSQISVVHPPVTRGNLNKEVMIKQNILVEMNI
jgi:hypothetical protein